MTTAVFFNMAGTTQARDTQIDQSDLEADWQALQVPFSLSPVALPSFVAPVVEQYAVDGVDCMTTFRLSVKLLDGAYNVHTIFGTPASTMILPAAYQVDSALSGVHTGGISPLLFEAVPSAEFDSWLTIGTVDGSRAFSIAGMDMESWTADSSLAVSNGAVTAVGGDAADMPIPGSTVVVAQMTIPSGASTVAVMNFAGNTQPRDDLVDQSNMQADWQASGIIFKMSTPFVVHPCAAVRHCFWRHIV
eukprot:SAG11_NODE_3193_length_2622_cov_1.318668_4_plen_247_part_00